MGEDVTWDESSREELRDTIRSVVLGEVRLASQDHDDIFAVCREVYIQDDCPDEEQDAFVAFMERELERVVAEQEAERASWPAETDCDRLDAAEAALRERGILLWQVSPCCDTCTGGELPDRIDQIEEQHPGFRKRVRGYAFFIDQNMADMLAEDRQIRVYLGYGWFAPDDAEVEPSAYEEKALGVAREVAECLREHGFAVDWNGELSRKIGLAIHWQRRGMLA